MGNAQGGAGVVPGGPAWSGMDGEIIFVATRRTQGRRERIRPVPRAMFGRIRSRRRSAPSGGHAEDDGIAPGFFAILGSPIKGVAGDDSDFIDLVPLGIVVIGFYLYGLDGGGDGGAASPAKHVFEVGSSDLSWSTIRTVGYLI